ncbi:MAG: carboxypeptidase-like regulatory domain-containing protein, partial [Ignavibacteriales bacterium]|nr:carboxypeptidase-like regulatory domain-containing protein [Ignavibacteriales bacterium]
MNKISFFLFLLLVSQNIFSQTRITGKVSDENNSPLIGANVFIQDTYDGTSTKEDGSFIFSTDEKSENAFLIVSYIGYKQYSKEIVLNGTPIHIEIVLEQDTKELGTVIISAGYFEASDEKKSIILRPLDILTTGSDADIYST